MYAVSVSEQSWIPVQIKYVEESTYTVVIDPKDAVVKYRSRIWIVIQRFLQILSPVFYIEFGVVASPSQMGPWIF